MIWHPRPDGVVSTSPPDSRAEFGLGLKLAAHVVRFERAAHMVCSTPSFVSVAQVATACGYYDQAHVDRGFADLAGCSPTMLLAEDLPHFQDTEVLRVASS